MPDNLSIDTYPQQQAAASPLMLVGRSFLRYAAWSPHMCTINEVDDASVARAVVVK